MEYFLILLLKRVNFKIWIMVKEFRFIVFLMYVVSTSAQTTIIDTGFKIVTESPIINLQTGTTDKISFYSDCVHCQYGKSDFNYFQIDLSQSKLEKTYTEFALGARLTGNLPVAKYPSKNNLPFDVSKYKEIELNSNGNIDTYNMHGREDYAFAPWRVSGDKYIYLAKSKYFGNISLFAGSNNSTPFKTDISLSDKGGYYWWISDLYSCKLFNKTFVSLKATDHVTTDFLYKGSELADLHYVYVMDYRTNKLEQKITIYERKTGLADYTVFYPLGDTGDFVILYSDLYGQIDKSNKNYGIYLHYYSANTPTAKGKYVKVWETKLSSDFTSVKAVSAANGQIVVGGTSRNGGYLGYENPYLNVFDMRTGKFKKEYYIPFKVEEGATVYNIVPLETSDAVSPAGKSVNGGAYGGTNGDLLICVQPNNSSFKESGMGKGILIRDYLNADGTFYNNLFNDETYKQNKPKKPETPCVQNREKDLPKLSEKFEVVAHVVMSYGSDKTLNSYCWVAQDKITKKIGIVSNSGKVVIPFEYDCQDFVSYSKNFEENKVYFILTKDGKRGIVDTSNKVIANFEFDNYWYGLNLKAECNYAVGLKNGKYGVISLKDGSVILDFKYDKLMPLNYGYEWEPCDVVHAQNGSFKGFIDFKGNIVFDSNEAPSDKFLEQFEKKMRERNSQ